MTETETTEPSGEAWINDMLKASNKAQTTLDEKINAAILEQTKIKENFIAHYLAETGAKISRTILVEQRSDDGLRTVYWCEPKRGGPKRDPRI